MGSSSPTAPATRAPRPVRSSCCKERFRRGSRTSGSASATSCSVGHSDSTPTSSPTATAGSTSRSSTAPRARSRSPRTTTGSRCARPSTPPPARRTARRPCRTSASTTTWSRAWSCAATEVWSPSPCSTTPRPPRVHTTPATSSTGSATFWRRCDRPRRTRERSEPSIMPRRTDIHTVLVIGSGPIVIGQACEFDYSGTQACRVLRQEGLRVVLVNSNPATTMTDPEFADATYVEPITPAFVEQVIAQERPDALLATLGGQTALNCAMSLAQAGVLEKYGVELIGASIEAIEKGENRESFKRIVEGLPAQWGAEVAASRICHSMDDCLGAVEELGYPVVVRPSFTMGGAGSGLAYDEDDLLRIAGLGLSLSPTNEVLLEESILGWKEYELEVMRDRADNVVIVCSIENLDPMGVHTGDSITVAPALTLTDREYQRLRDIAIGVIREVGVDTGGCNIQFAVNPDNGRIVVIEMNPRVSRSSVLASKATGFPIAKIAAK